VATPTASPFIFYYHGDMLGTTRRTTNGPGNMVDTAAYTGFGEFLGGSTDRRYGFAGAWQYQSHPGTGFPFLHVGHRYYDPAIGRFLQRDPIGIGGGVNVYGYVMHLPTLHVDPSGLARDRGNWSWTDFGAWGAGGAAGGGAFGGGHGAAGGLAAGCASYAAGQFYYYLVDIASYLKRAYDQERDDEITRGAHPGIFRQPPAPSMRGELPPNDCRRCHPPPRKWDP
jgi:RHS repeat-associated protein